MGSTEVLKKKKKKNQNMFPNNDLKLLFDEPIICLHMVHDRRTSQKEWEKPIIFKVSHH